MINTNLVWYLNQTGEKRVNSGYRALRESDIVNHAVIDGSEKGELYPLLSSKGKNIGLVLAKKGNFVASNVLLGWSSMDGSSLSNRIERSLHRRQSYGIDPEYCRVLFGSSDETSGLVLDRYGDTWVAMIYEPIWYRILETFAEELMEHLSMKSLVLKSPLPQLKTTVLGECIEETWVYEYGRKVWTDVIDGQKTGWYYDQRANRQALKPFVESGHWVDVCCYHGAFGLAALEFGAERVTFVDCSVSALNGVKCSVAPSSREQVSYACEDAALWMENEAQEGRKYSGVMCDPPCFVKGKKMNPAAEGAYLRWMYLCVDILSPGGVLVFSSCSSSISRKHLVKWIHQVLNHKGRSGSVLYQGRADKDHPYHASETEMDYLSCIMVQVTS